jgi:hypothetical protein
MATFIIVFNLCYMFVPYHSDESISYLEQVPYLSPGQQECPVDSSCQDLPDD